MSKLVFRLNDVPIDEADGVRTLLKEADIDFYETEAGRWGFSVAGIWLKDEDRFEEAREQIEHFQREHVQRVRAEYEQRRSQGETETFVARLWRHPMQVLFLVAFVAGVLYFSLMPFLSLGD